MGNVVHIDTKLVDIEAKKTYAGTFPTLPSRGYFKKGDKGTQVKNLQKFLNWALDLKLSVDGIIGDATINAVKQFQKEVKIYVDGLFGKDCLSKAKTYTK
jgi:peptidoglycan hydrolase-like protein with peptidoglycan-binding domain